jgi:hypothetical protein
MFGVLFLGIRMTEMKKRVAKSFKQDLNQPKVLRWLRGSVSAAVKKTLLSSKVL